MGKTKKVGITGKYGTRYGANLRKRVRKYDVSKKSAHFCHFCGKYSFRRSAAGIWNCRSCQKVYAGGCFTLNTSAGLSSRSTIRRLRELREGKKN